MSIVSPTIALYRDFPLRTPVRKPFAMNSKPMLLALALLALSAASVPSASTSPYAGQERREIKALSDAEVEGLLAGKGMGFAKAAELNGYPGPAHVLELASRLGLSQTQVTRTRAIYRRMEADAKAAGALLVEAERELDALFRSRSATPESLAATLEKVSAAGAKVREAHLTAHIEQARLLSEAQVALYDRLRGYEGGHGHDTGQDAIHEHHR